MAATGRTVQVSAVSHGATSIPKVTALNFAEAGTRITTAEDNDTYVSGQFVHTVDTTGSITSRDTNACKALAVGGEDTLSATLHDEDGSSTYSLSISNATFIGVPRTQGYGAWGETTVNWGAKSSDGSTSPISIT
jgi:hypothetical protein